MNVHYECLSCMVTQAQKASELATEDITKRREAMLKVAQLAGRYYREESIPAVDASLLFLEIYKLLNNDDPFKNYKE